MCRHSIFSAVIAGWLCSVAAHAQDVGFTSKPVVTKDGGSYHISFAVNKNLDLAVYVEDAKGEVVRHLAAGVLGPKAPVPLKCNSLVQEIAWDSINDDGRPAGAGPFKVRVGLGLKTSYAGEAFTAADMSGPNKLESVMGLAAGPDGHLYVLQTCQAMVWSSTRISVFSRAGAYENTIKPFPSSLPVARAAGAGAFVNSLGGFNPFIHRVQGLSFYPAEEIAHQPAVMPNGQIVLAVNRTRLALLDADGGIPKGGYGGGNLGAGLKFTAYPFLAADTQGVFVSGLVKSDAKTVHAIYRVSMPQNGPAEVWFGDADKSGADDSHVNDVRGVALDGNGHLLIADAANDRVLVVNTKDKTVAGSIAVKSPQWVDADGKSGAIYVHSMAQGAGAVIKFADWKNAQEAGRVTLPPAAKNQVWRLALDATAQPVVLWAAAGVRLLRCQDAEGHFSDLAPADCHPSEFYWRPTADPTRHEVLCRKGGAAGYGSWLEIMNEATGEIRTLDKRAVAGLEGRSHRLGPDGSIYCQDHAGQAGGILRLDRDGNPKPFAATLDDPYLKGRLPVGPTGTTNWERDFGVDRKGDVYVRARGPEYHGHTTVHIYDPDGNLKRIVLQTVSDGMYGPRIDPQGNLYIMDSIKAIDTPMPKEFEPSLAAFPGTAEELSWIYGSIIKFPQAGGAIWFNDGLASPLTYEGWGSGRSVSGLKTTSGCLVGSIAKAPATLNFPGVRVDAEKCKTVTLRLKNESDGKQAILSYHRLRESYVEACGDGFSKPVDIKPDSDFTEYAFDLSGEKDWRDIVWNLKLVPTDARKGAFQIDWVRIGAPDSPMVWNFNAEDGPDRKLPDTMQKEKVAAYGRREGATLQGALWWKDGFSPLGDMSVAPAGRCHCTGSDFDVDDFGRVFAPDTGRFRVGVLDTAGNEILSFGGYGNQDCRGPDSYVVDAQTKRLRPRHPDDTPGLSSPSASPEIGLAWITGMAVTDKYAYVSDVINKRVLRVKLGYAVDERCDMP